MTQRRRILVASPIEPSGASWLLNCFLELGIRIEHKPVVDRVWRGPAPSAPDRMWVARDDGRVALNPRAGVLKKFLPALVRHEDFRFRDDVSVDYVQDFPAPRPDGGQRVLMVRDPRDAFYSSFRRTEPTLSFAEFLGFPNPATLLDRSAHWALFVASWLSLPNIDVVRFEDYKRDAEATLRAVLAKLALGYADRDIEAAVALSSFERAREAEQLVRDQYRFDRQLANRSGTVGEGRDHALVQASIPQIERETATMLHALGYDVQARTASDAFAAARLSTAFLTYFETVHLPEAVTRAKLDMAASEPALSGLLSFTRRLDSGLLARTGLSPAESRLLIDSLQEFLRRHAAWQAEHLSSIRRAFEDGSDHFFRRIRDTRHSAGSGAVVP